MSRNNLPCSSTQSFCPSFYAVLECVRCRILVNLKEHSKQVWLRGAMTFTRSFPRLLTTNLYLSSHAQQSINLNLKAATYRTIQGKNTFAINPTWYSA